MRGGDAPAENPLLVDFPFSGRWMARNSPAARVPSHGTHRFGMTYAVDFVAVGDDNRSAPRRWRRFVTAEDPEIFVGFGARITSPVDGTVVVAHDGERDHAAHRSPLGLLGYMLTQGRRVRQGPAGIAGNHVAIETEPGGRFVWLVHLQNGSVSCAVGDRLLVGDPIGRCGNSGNSTEPHLHLQATDSLDLSTARGVPITFRAYRTVGGRVVRQSVPDESEVFVVPVAGHG